MKSSIIAISVVDTCQKEVLAMKSNERESQENRNLGNERTHWNIHLAFHSLFKSSYI